MPPPRQPMKRAPTVTKPTRTSAPVGSVAPAVEPRQRVTANKNLRPGKFTFNELLNRTRANWAQQDWARANANGAPFRGDKGLTYNTRLKVIKPSLTPWGLRFQTVTTDPIEFGRDPKGRYPRRYVQYIQLSRSFASTNINGEKTFQLYCSCPRFKLFHHYVLWRNGHAPMPATDAGRQPPKKTNPYQRVGQCKHLILASLALRRLSLRNAIPTALPESAWRDMALYWKKVESQGMTPGEDDNPPNKIKRIAREVVQTGKVPRGTPVAEINRVKDFADTITPRRIRRK